MIYAILDLKNRVLTCCQAGHTPLLVQRADGTLDVYENGNVPIGLSEEFRYEQFPVQLQQAIA